MTVPGAIMELRECTAVVSPERSVSSCASIVTRARSGRWGGTECLTADAETGDRVRGWRERRMVGRGAGSHACCGVRSGSLSRLTAGVAGDAVRRGQVQAERRMKARISTSSPMERP